MLGKPREDKTSCGALGAISALYPVIKVNALYYGILEDTLLLTITNNSGNVTRKHPQRGVLIVWESG